MEYPKRLIEVDLPIKRISAHARREKSIRHGHISTLHIWWARRPLAACRAVICASLWPDPADPLCPQSFREAAERELRAFAKAATTDREVMEICDDESWKRYGRLTKRNDPMDLHTLPTSTSPTPATAGDEVDSDELTDLERLRGLLLDFIADAAAWEASVNSTFLQTARNITQAAHESLTGNHGTRPLVVDPFAGGGAIPLEALRVGADSFASDLNPVAVLLNKAMLEYVPKFGRELADQVRDWGQRIRDEVEAEIGKFYSSGPSSNAAIAYIWARTIRCEGPGCGVSIPLLRSPWLLKKGKQRVGLKLIPDPNSKCVHVEVCVNPKSSDIGDGTVKRGVPTCPLCGFSTPLRSVKTQFRERRGGAGDARLLAVVEEGDQRQFRSATEQDVEAVLASTSTLERMQQDHDGPLSFVPDEDTEHYHSFVNRASVYGLKTWGDFYLPRQRLALGCFAKHVRDVANKEGDELHTAVATLLAFAVDRCADYWSSLATWGGQFIAHTFGRQALPFVWDCAEANPFSSSTGNWLGAVEWIARVIERESVPAEHQGQAMQSDAAGLPLPDDSAQAFITDPPYYYAIQYADLADYFYVWLRRTLGDVHRDLLRLPETPKAEEAIVQSPGDEYSDDPKNRKHYEQVMAKALLRGRQVTAPNGVGVVVFANATTSGWESLLDALISTGWVVTGSWPIDTERPGRVISSGRSVLASSVHLACRPREKSDGSLQTDEVGDWRDVLAELPRRIGEWMPRLSREGVVGADAIFACLGPALEIFSRYSRVEKASGEEVSLRDYLEQVWAAVAQEALRMLFEGADTSAFEEDARLTAMWLWTLKTAENGNGDDEDEEAVSSGGYVLEYDAARKIAQGLGAHLDALATLVAVKGDEARLLPVEERSPFLFGKEDAPKTGKKKKRQQKSLFAELDDAEAAEGGWGEGGAPSPGQTTLDRLHQAMLLFASGRGAAMRRFLVEEGAGRDSRFWTLAQVLSALYPSHTQEKRWVDGVLARKKGLGF